MPPSKNRQVVKQLPVISRLKELALRSDRHPFIQWVLRQALMLVPRLHVLYLDMKRGDLFKHASAMAYVTLLSIVPSLAAMFAIISLFSPLMGPESQLLNKARDFILSNLARGSGEQVITYLDSFVANLDMQKIGISGFVGVLISLVMLLRQIESALNRVWEVEDDRSLFKRFFYFWSFLTLGLLIASLAIGLLTGSKVMALLDFGTNVVPVAPSLFAFVWPWIGGFLFFFALYKVVPNCFVTLREAAIGALLATALFNLGGVTYGFYAQNMANYKNVYGAVAAIPVFLLWLYIMWLIILLGAVLARRSALGYPTDEELARVDEDLAPLERQRNHHLRAVIPLVALLAVYRQSARGTGEGVRGLSIAAGLGLPGAWVSEAMASLEAAKLVVGGIQGGKSAEVIPDPLHREYFPTVAADLLPVARMMDALSVETRRWFADWLMTAQGKEIAGALQILWRLPRQEWEQSRMADVIRE